MIVLIPSAALLLALFAAYIAVQTRKSYALRYLLIAAAAAFGVTFFYLFPKLLGRPAPRYPTGDFHMIAMIEQGDNQVEMWVATKDGTRLYHFTAPPETRKQLRSMTDGHGQGIYSLTGRFMPRSSSSPNGEDAQLQVQKPDLTRLPQKNEGAPRPPPES